MDRNNIKENQIDVEPTIEELIQEISAVNSRLIIENAAMKIKIAKMEQLLKQHEACIKQLNNSGS